MAVQIEGERNVLQMFNDAIGWTSEESLLDDLEEQANDIADDARANAPGSLSQGIEVVRDTEFEEPQAVIKFKESHFYGQFPEYGTDEQREQAFVRGAAFGRADEVPEELKDSLEDELE